MAGMRIVLDGEITQPLVAAVAARTSTPVTAAPDVPTERALFHFDLNLAVAIAGIIEGLVALYELRRIKKADTTWSRDRLVAVIGEAMLRAGAADFRILDVTGYDHLAESTTDPCTVRVRDIAKDLWYDILVYGDGETITLTVH